MKPIKLAMAIAIVIVIGCAGSTNLTSAKVYYNKNQDYPKAEKFSRLAIDEDPKNWEAYFYLALSLAKQEKLDEVGWAFRKAKELAPESKRKGVVNNQRSFFANYYNKGITATDMERYSQAITYFLNAAKVDPDDAKALVNLGVAYSNLDSMDLAVDAFKKAIEVDSGYIDAWRNLGITYRLLGQHDLEVKAFEKAVELAPDDIDVVFSLGDAYFSVGEYEKSLQYYQRVAESKPEVAPLHYQIGEVFFNLHRFIEAGQAFQKAAAFSRNDDIALYKDAMFNLGVTYVRTENFDGAIEVFNTLLEIEETPEIHEMLGACYSKKGMTDKALKEFKRAEEIRNR